VTAADQKSGPVRQIVAVLGTYRSKGRYGTETKDARERVRMACGHERAWYAGRSHARCGACRPGAVPRPVRVARTPQAVLSPEQALVQYEKLINKLAWKTVRQLPPTSTFSQEDLYQEGAVVTLNSLARYNPTKSAFITYLYVSLNNRYGQILKREWRETQALPRAALERITKDGAVRPLEIAVEPEQEATEQLLRYTCQCDETAWYREHGYPVPRQHSCGYVAGRNEDLDEARLVQPASWPGAIA
jgi:hypothetical protein